MNNHESDDVNTSQNCIGQKQKEVFLIFSSNSVIHPWTKVVHSGYTPIANSIVMRVGMKASQLPHIAIGPPSRISFGNGRAFCGTVLDHPSSLPDDSTST